MSIDDLKKIPECVVICNSCSELENLFSVCFEHGERDEKHKEVIMRRYRKEGDYKDGIGIRLYFGKFKGWCTPQWYYNQGGYTIFMYEEIFDVQQDENLISIQFEDLF